MADSVPADIGYTPTDPAYSAPAAPPSDSGEQSQSISSQPPPPKNKITSSGAILTGGFNMTWKIALVSLGSAFAPSSEVSALWNTLKPHRRKKPSRATTKATSSALKSKSNSLTLATPPSKPPPAAGARHFPPPTLYKDSRSDDRDRFAPPPPPPPPGDKGRNPPGSDRPLTFENPCSSTASLLLTNSLEDTNPTVPAVPLLLLLLPTSIADLLLQTSIAVHLLLISIEVYRLPTLIDEAPLLTSCVEMILTVATLEDLQCQALAILEAGTILDHRCVISVLMILTTLLEGASLFLLTAHQTLGQWASVVLLRHSTVLPGTTSTIRHLSIALPSMGHRETTEMECLSIDLRTTLLLSTDLRSTVLLWTDHLSTVLPSLLERLMIRMALEYREVSSEVLTEDTILEDLDRWREVVKIDDTTLTMEGLTRLAIVSVVMTEEGVRTGTVTDTADVHHAAVDHHQKDDGHSLLLVAMGLQVAIEMEIIAHRHPTTLVATNLTMLVVLLTVAQALHLAILLKMRATFLVAKSFHLSPLSLFFPSLFYDHHSSPPLVHHFPSGCLALRLLFSPSLPPTKSSLTQHRKIIFLNDSERS